MFLHLWSSQKNTSYLLSSSDSKQWTGTSELDKRVKVTLKYTPIQYLLLFRIPIQPHQRDPTTFVKFARQKSRILLPSHPLGMFSAISV